MSSLPKGTRTTRFERYYPYLRFLRDLAFSLADIFSQCTTIRPWYLIFPVLALKALVIISYTYGNNVDHHIPKGVDGLVVIRGPRGCYLFEGDRGEAEREKRMGALGQPVGDIEERVQRECQRNGQSELASVWRDQDRGSLPRLPLRRRQRPGSFTPRSPIAPQAEPSTRSRGICRRRITNAARPQERVTNNENGLFPRHVFPRTIVSTSVFPRPVRNARRWDRYTRATPP